MKEEKFLVEVKKDWLDEVIINALDNGLLVDAKIDYMKVFGDGQMIQIMFKRNERK
jgi:hypothetical protein